MDFYISLGDSQTDNDHYAVRDALERGILTSGSTSGLGSGSLLWQNRDDLWPEFAGEDLYTRYPEARYLPLAMDGAVISSVRHGQLPTAEESVGSQPAIVTLTVGGNDALQALSTRDLGHLARAMEAIGRDYTALVADVRNKLPTALLILNTVYDPTDGTGMLRGHEEYGRLPVELLDEFNDLVRALAARTDHAVLADIHRHFLGRGIQEDFRSGYYWRGSVIEPGYRGASEIRRLWLEAVGAAEI